MSNPKKPTLSLYRKASGKSTAKKFTKSEYLSIVDGQKELATGKCIKKIVMPDGYQYRASSQEEKTVIQRLLKSEKIESIRGQQPAIAYRFGGKDKTYYPDLFVLTKTGRIVVIEVKQIAEMGTKVNQRKYKALKNYCESKGYLYMMCDKSMETLEEVRDKWLHGSTEMAIDKALEEKGRFGSEDYKKLIEGADRKTIKKIRRRIGIYIVSRNDYLKEVGNLTFESQRFLIKLKDGIDVKKIKNIRKNLESLI